MATTPSICIHHHLPVDRHPSSHCAHLTPNIVEASAAQTATANNSPLPLVSLSHIAEANYTTAALTCHFASTSHHHNICEFVIIVLHLVHIYKLSLPYTIEAHQAVVVVALPPLQSPSNLEPFSPFLACLLNPIMCLIYYVVYFSFFSCFTF